MNRAREASPRFTRRLVATAFAICVALAATGCSAVYTQSGQLSQAASDAAAQAQTGAVALLLSNRHALPSPSTDTALSDAIDELGQDGSSLTGADVSGNLALARDRILARLREAEDLLIRGRRLAGQGSGPVTMHAVVQELRVTARQLSALGQQVQAAG